LFIDAFLKIVEPITGKESLLPIEVTKGLDLIPSSLDLIKAEIELSGEFKNLVDLVVMRIMIRIN